MLSLLDKGNSSSDVSLLHDSESEESDVLYQLGFESEELEMQEESIVDALQEAEKVKHIAESSTEPMNPAQLALDSVALWKLDMFSPVPKDAEDQMSRNASEKPAKEPNSGSSPSSSVDLEWENEHGLPPLKCVPAREDDSSDTANCSSQLSTPVSNGNEELEWDGHFTSTHITQLDLETEQLISEIQRLTSGALTETKPDC